MARRQLPDPDTYKIPKPDVNFQELEETELELNASRRKTAVSIEMIKRWSWGALAAVLVGFIIYIACLFAWLLYEYLRDIVETPEKLERFLLSIWHTLTSGSVISLISLVIYFLRKDSGNK